MKEKLILTDCDGVLLHWEWVFDRWMTKHGYYKEKEGHYEIEDCYNISKEQAKQLVKMFNETVYVTKLPPLYDAIKYVKLLHEDYGYIFHVITSIGDDPEIVEGRVKNLTDVFGSSPFYRITCLDPAISKKESLLQYKDSECYWIEDHPENYLLGKELGLDVMLVDQHYNYNFKTPNRVYSWKEIYKRITND